MVNNHRGYILHKEIIKKERDMTIYSIYKKNHPVTPSKQVVNVVDLGYLGVEKDFPEQLSALPNKRRETKKSYQEEKEYNKIHSKKRIIVEHTISRLKKYRIMSDIFRNKLRSTTRYWI